MVQCVMCPPGKCLEDCPIAEVLPSCEGPLKEDIIRKAKKIKENKTKEYIKQKLREAGDAYAKNKLINKWIEDFDSRDLGPFVKNIILLLQKQKQVAELEKSVEHGKEFLKALKSLRTSAPVVVDDESAPVPVVFEKESKGKMVQCCLCSFGKCSEECPTLDVLPYEGPLKEESIRKAQTLQASGREIKDIKESLKVAGVDAKNQLINKWIEEFDSREKGPLYHIIKNKLLILQQQRVIDEKTKNIEDVNKSPKAKKLKTSSIIVDDESAPVADEGLEKVFY